MLENYLQIPKKLLHYYKQKAMLLDAISKKHWTACWKNYKICNIALSSYQAINKESKY